MILKAPIKFRPYLKTVIWGGDRICAFKGIAQDEQNVGESWEISNVPGHESVVAEGEYAGRSLPDLIDCFGVELLGRSVVDRYGSSFPLLIKFIDANDNLSVQVHPDDRLAQKRHDSMGKTEMWYIIDARKDARIYAGLRVEMTPEEYERRVADDSIMETLAVHEAAAGDVFFLPAGRVHAIGAGNLLAEIQESSDITYRIYDYNRRDKDGNPRELHTELAKDAIDYKVYGEYKKAPVADDVKIANLADCEHFVTKRLLLSGDESIARERDSFIIIICVEGTVVLSCPDGETTIRQGETALIPAAVEKISLSGNATLLVTQS